MAQNPTTPPVFEHLRAATTSAATDALRSVRAEITREAALARCE